MTGMRELPTGWHWDTIGSVAKVASNLVDPALYPDYPHIAPNHIQSNTGLLLPYATVASDGVISAKHLFHPGQILYSKIRPYLAKAAYVNFSGLCSADIYPLETSLIPAYLLHWLLSPEFTQYASRVQGRTVLPKINRQQLEELPVPVAPQPDQGTIAAALEEQFSRLDAGVDAIARVRLNLRRIRAAIFDAAVSGLLVSKDDDSTGSIRLANQLRLEGGPVKFKTVTPEPSYVVSLPANWQIVALAEMAESIVYGTSEKTSAQGEGIPVLRMSNLGRGTISFGNLKRLPAERIDKKLYLQPGDLLFNRTNSPELVGKSAVFTGYEEGVSFASYLIRVRPLPSANLEWASIVLNSSIGRRYVSAVRTQQVGQANVNGTKLAAMPIPLPSAEEQARIIEECSRMISMVDSLERIAISVAKHGDLLRASIVAAAFSGNLA